MTLVLPVLGACYPTPCKPVDVKDAAGRAETPGDGIKGLWATVSNCWDLPWYSL